MAFSVQGKGGLLLLPTAKLPAELQHLFATAFSKRIQNKNSPNEVLYHYTSLTSLMGMVESRKIWMSKADFLNDSSEMVYFSEVLKKSVSHMKDVDSAEAWHHYIRKFEDCMNGFLNDIDEDGLEVYVFSLSHNKDSLALWYNYAQGDGYNIGFEAEDLVGKGEKILKTINGIHGFVLYQEEEQEEFLRESLRDAYELFNRQEKQGNDIAFEEYFNILLAACATFFKNPAFKSEEEYRLAAVIGKESRVNVEFRARHGIIIPFIAVELGDILPICHVTIGPKNNIDVAKKGVDYYLKSKGYNLDKVKVSKSIAALRY
ncbi:DUF2971 domain-containing protein [Planococcus halotolerans]|uniref:DUF2971 domain-containing protein n=1 Tax=Planococcus halotolerans TaxID=2233542 RepID=A0A365KR51_9BACL|nr:DUF2971 domain-containing protein [Planococcus halotolerans]